MTFITGKRVVPPVPPKRSVIISIDTPPATSRRRDDISSFAMFIEYRDSSSAISHRRIACRTFDPSADVLNAWCFEREALRAFRYDRIVSAACTETGEFFDLGSLIQTLRANGLPVRDAGLNASLKVLVFLMRCDGIHAAEEAALEDAITGYAIRFNGDDEMVESGIRQARTMAPDERDFLKALRYVTKRRQGPALARFVQAQAQRIIDADGRHSAEETRFAIELDELLAKTAART